MIRKATPFILLLVLFGVEMGGTRAAEREWPSQMSEPDVDYFLKGIDIDKGTIDPGKPQSATQAVLFEMMEELNALNAKHAADVAKFEPFEFSVFGELGHKEKVLFLQKNLRGYWDCRRKYYSQKDEWLKKYRKKIGKTQSGGRLHDTLDFYFEKLERIYVNDLSDFYSFVWKNHSKMAFNNDGILVEDGQLVDQLNELWGRVAKSAGEIAKVREGGAEVIRNLATWKKERGAR